MPSTITLEEIIKFLLEAPMFGDLDAEELSRVVHIMQIQRLRPGQYLFREGQRGEAWYVTYEGEVEVTKDAGFGTSPLARLRSPACLGEMAVLDGSPRSATARAVGEVTVLRFPREAFDDLLEDGNLAAFKLVYQMARVLAARQRQTTSALVELIENQSGPLEHELQPIVRRTSVSE